MKLVQMVLVKMRGLRLLAFNTEFRNSLLLLNDFCLLTEGYTKLINCFLDSPVIYDDPRLKALIWCSLKIASMIEFWGPFHLRFRSFFLVYFVQRKELLNLV